MPYFACSGIARFDADDTIDTAIRTIRTFGDIQSEFGLTLMLIRTMTSKTTICRPFAPQTFNYSYEENIMGSYSYHEIDFFFFLLVLISVKTGLYLGP